MLEVMGLNLLCALVLAVFLAAIYCIGNAIRSRKAKDKSDAGEE